MTNQLLSVMALASATLSCATWNPVKYSAVNPPPHPFVRRDPAAVDVTIGKPPTRPYVDVGLFEVYEGYDSDGSWRMSTEKMIASLRRHAALRGCDAVQILGLQLVGKSEAQSSRMVTGVCEMYTDEKVMRAASAPPPPLPDEGKPCVVPEGGGYVPPPCPDPLICSHNTCASPYQ